MSSRGKIRAGIISKHQHHFPSFSKPLLAPAHIPLLLLPSCCLIFFFPLHASSSPLSPCFPSATRCPLCLISEPSSTSLISHPLNCQIKHWHENRTVLPQATPERPNLSGFSKAAFKSRCVSLDGCRKPSKPQQRQTCWLGVADLQSKSRSLAENAGNKTCIKWHYFRPSWIYVIDAVHKRFTTAQEWIIFLFLERDVELKMVALLSFHLLHQTRLTENFFCSFGWVYSSSLNAITYKNVRITSGWLGSVQFNLDECVSLWVCGSQTGQMRNVNEYNSLKQCCCHLQVALVREGLQERCVFSPLLLSRVLWALPRQYCGCNVGGVQEVSFLWRQQLKLCFR